jgi:4-hydroxybenzoate polyprenyltransferase
MHFIGNIYQMLKYLQLIRWVNLLIVIATLFIMRWFILKPLLEYAGYPLLFSEWRFILLVLSAAAYTAAGYVINDYFDTQTDYLNRPERVIIGKGVARRQAMILHFALNIIAAALGIYISFYIGIPALAVICLLIPGILWFYSTTYKRQLIIGNLIVAALTALVPLSVFLSEMPLQIRMQGEILLSNHVFVSTVFYWIGGFAFFAFILTLIREIVKDVEDFEGDAAFGRNSLPVALGIQPTKLILDILIFITILAIGFLYFNFLHDVLSLIYFIVFLIGPLGFILYLLNKAKERKDYSFISLLLKIVMLAGLAYAILANFILRNNLG